MESKKEHGKNTALTLAFLIIVLFGVLSFVNKELIVKSIKTPSYSSNGSAKEKKETDLKATIKLGFKEVEKWSNSVKLVEASSADEGDSTEYIRGEDGRRYSWTLMFADEEESNKYYYIKILGGKIVNQRETQGFPFGPIKLDDVKLNSLDALIIAKKYKDLKPGKEWAIGYHYVLSQPKDTPIITVYGYTPEGNFSFIEINAENEKVISSYKKIYDQNGNSSWVNY